MNTNQQNPFTWVEIYVANMPRAKAFYEHVFSIELTPMEAPGGFGDLEMYCFPWNEGGANISGALCKTESIPPGSGGTIVYFTSDNCDIETSRVEAAAGKIIQEKFQIGPHGYVALALDTEGNTIGFHSNR